MNPLVVDATSIKFKFALYIAACVITSSEFLTATSQYMVRWEIFEWIK